MEKPARFFSCYLLIYALTCWAWQLACVAGRINRLAAGLSESPVYVGALEGKRSAVASVFARVIRVPAALGIRACLAERVDGVLMNVARPRWSSRERWTAFLGNIFSDSGFCFFRGLKRGERRKGVELERIAARCPRPPPLSAVLAIADEMSCAMMRTNIKAI